MSKHTPVLFGECDHCGSLAVIVIYTGNDEDFSEFLITFSGGREWICRDCWEILYERMEESQR